MSIISLCVNTEEIEPQAADAFAGVSIPSLAARATALAAAGMREDPACRRAPRAHHYAGVHKVAEREALALNTPRHIVAMTARWRRKLSTLARDLQDVCAAAQSVADAKDDKGALLCDRANRLIAKAGHMNLRDLEARAEEVAIAYRQYMREAQQRALGRTAIYEQRTIKTPDNAEWRLLRSCAELTEAGAALRNCWAAERPFSARYQDYLRSRQAEFWVLQLPRAKKPSRALMLDLRQNAVVEVRGPCNQEVNPAEPNLIAFLEARRCLLMVTVLNSRMPIDHTKVSTLLGVITRAAPKSKGEHADA